MRQTFAGPTWLYHQDGRSELFAEGAEHPGEGWFDHPRKAKGEPEPEPEIVEGFDPSAGPLELRTPNTPDVERLEREKAEILEEARARIDGLNGQVEAAALRVNELTGEVAELTGQAAIDRTTIEGQAAEIERLKGELAEAQAQLAKFDPDNDGKAGGARKKAG